MAGNSKNFIPPSHIISAASMASNVTSAVVPIMGSDNFALVLTWTGTPTGTFAVQVNSTYIQSPGGTLVQAGTWQTLPLSAPIAASGSADDARISLSQLPDTGWLRVVYTASSGSGTLDCYLDGKAI